MFYVHLVLYYQPMVCLTVKKKVKSLLFLCVQWCFGNEGNVLIHVYSVYIAVELKVRNWTKFNVRAACRPLESGQWIQTLAPDIPPTANSTATVRILTCNYRTSARCNCICLSHLLL